MPGWFRPAFTGRVLAASLLTAGVAAGAGPAPRAADYVFVLMLDGTRPDILRQVNAPTLKAMGEAGTVYLQAETIYPSQTRVAFVSLPTGSYPGGHGIVGGDEYKDAEWRSIGMGNDDPIAAQSLCARPTMFEDTSAAGLTSLYAAMKGYELVGARGATWTINGNRTLEARAYASRYQSDVFGSQALAVWYKRKLSRDLLDQAMQVFREHRPNLMVLNLGSADYTAHSLGPASAEYRTTLEFLDGLIADLRATLKQLGVLERTTFIVSADHGFSDVDHKIMVAPFEDGKSPQIDALTAAGIENWVSNTGGASAGIYIRDKARVSEAVAILRHQPWMEGIYCEDSQAGCDRSLSELHAYFPGRSPELMVDLDDDSDLGRPRPGQHGSLRPTDMRIPLILSGAGVVPGQLLGRASLVDVAPTVLRLLGVPQKLLRPDGRLLEEALVH